MANLSRSKAEARPHRPGSPMGTGMMCDCDDIIGIPAERSASRVFSTHNPWAIRSPTDLLRYATLLVAAAATGGGIAVVKIKLEAAERIASQMTASAAI